MNKIELLVWLTDHLDSWPSSLKNTPLIQGWSWYVNKLNREVYITSKNHTAGIISQDEWAEESAKTVEPSTPIKPLEVEAMIDIETFDTSNDAIVFQAAIIMFDKHHAITYRETWNLDFDEQFKAGRTVSASTAAFHLGIPANAEKALKDQTVASMTRFASCLARVIEKHGPKHIWAKGSFDFNILENMFDMAKFPAPWKFYQLRELRTLMSECNVKKGDVAHNALADCVAQVAQLAQCRAKIALGVEYAAMTDEQEAEKFYTSPIGQIDRHPSNASLAHQAYSIALNWSRNIKSPLRDDALGRITSAINTFLSTPKLCLVIIGSEGSGKTLLANAVIATFEMYTLTGDQEILTSAFGMGALAKSRVDCMLFDGIDDIHAERVQAMITNAEFKVEINGHKAVTVPSPKVILTALKPLFISKLGNCVTLDLDALRLDDVAKTGD